jgi:hypothetical protein
LISSVGMLSVYIGYSLTVGRKIARRTPRVPDAWDPQRSVRFGIYVLIACGLLTAAFAATVGPSALFHFYLGRSSGGYQTFAATGTGYVSLGPYLTIPAAIIFAYAFLRLRTFKTFLLFALSAGVAIFITFPRGDRTYIIAMILPLLVLPSLHKRTRPSGPPVVIALFVAILAMNIFLATRNVSAREPLLPTIGNAFTHPGAQLKQFATGTDLAEFSVLELEHEAYSTKVDPLTFHPGQTLLCLSAYWLPRKLVKHKPPAAAQWVINRLFPSNLKSSFNPALFGDFWADDGWFTVVLYDIIVGIVLRWIWEYFKRHEGSEGMQIVFASVLPVIVIAVRNSVVDAFARDLFLSGPLLLCLITCSRPRMRRLAGWRIKPQLKQPALGTLTRFEQP